MRHYFAAAIIPDGSGDQVALLRSALDWIADNWVWRLHEPARQREERRLRHTYRTRPMGGPPLHRGCSSTACCRDGARSAALMSGKMFHRKQGEFKAVFNTNLLKEPGEVNLYGAFRDS